MTNTCITLSGHRVQSEFAMGVLLILKYTLFTIHKCSEEFVSFLASYAVIINFLAIYQLYIFNTFKCLTCVGT